MSCPSVIANSAWQLSLLHISCRKPDGPCSSLFATLGAPGVSQPPPQAGRDSPVTALAQPLPLSGDHCYGHEPANVETCPFLSQQLPPPRTQAEEYLGEGRQAPWLQTHLVLIASANPKQLMAGRKRRRNRTLGERKGRSKQREPFTPSLSRGAPFTAAVASLAASHSWSISCAVPRSLPCLVLCFKP